MSANTREFAIGVACALSVVVLWSSFHLIARIGVQTSLTPYDLVALRLGVGGVLMLPVVLRHGLGSLQLWQAFVLAMLAGPGFALFAFTGYQFAPAAHGAAILAGAIPLFTAPIAWLALGERLSIWQVAGLAVILTGVMLLASGSFTGLVWRGDLLFLIGVADWAVFTLLARAWRVEPLRGTALVAVISMITYVPIHFAFLPSRLDTAPLIAIAGQALYQGVLSMIISLLLYTRAVAALGAALTTTITAAVPATATIAAFILLGEPLTGLTGGGVILVTIGMLAAVLGVRTLTPATRPAPATGKP
jgi:drug/metabolite transporter (DMT)-like permease